MKKIVIFIFCLCCLVGCGKIDNTNEGPSEGMTFIWNRSRYYDLYDFNRVNYDGIYRNEFGFEIKRTSYEDGKEKEGYIDVPYGFEERDENGRLFSYKDVLDKYFFYYDGKGELIEIVCQDKYRFTYSERDDAKFMYISLEDSESTRIHYDDRMREVYAETLVEDGEYAQKEKVVYDAADNIVYREYYKTEWFGGVYNPGGVKIKVPYREEYTYDGDNNIIMKKVFSNSKLMYEDKYTYNDNGNLVLFLGLEFGEDLSPKGEEYKRIEYTYDADKVIMKREFLNSELVCEDKYTYNAKGNLILLLGLKFGEDLSPNGEEYKRLEYTNDDYDEKGQVKVKYDDNGIKWTNEYDGEGQLIKSSNDSGEYTEYDKEGNIIEQYKNSYMAIIRYDKFEIVDNDLLIAFHQKFDIK